MPSIAPTCIKSKMVQIPVYKDDYKLQTFSNVRPIVPNRICELGFELHFRGGHDVGCWVLIPSQRKWKTKIKIESYIFKTKNVRNIMKLEQESS